MVKFLKKIPVFAKYVWPEPEKEDIETHSRQNIFEILPKPQMDRREFLSASSAASDDMNKPNPEAVKHLFSKGGGTWSNSTT